MDKELVHLSKEIDKKIAEKCLSS